MISGINSSVSALLGLQKKTANTANNVANINTPGFKASRLTLQDNASQNVSTAAGSSQVGRGVSVSTISQDQSQGPLAPTENASDLGISGNGYFVLRDAQASEAASYSRVGEFQFDSSGSLVTPSGSYVQGWQLEKGERQGSIGDITVPKTSEPQSTSVLTQIVNLDARQPVEEDNQPLYQSWDGSARAGSSSEPPISSNRFDYSTTARVYDSQGTGRDITIYYDRTPNSNEWEFLVTTDPSQDQRLLDSSQQNPSGAAQISPTDKGAGALLYGTIQFSNNGTIDSMQTYQVPANGELDPTSEVNRVNLASDESLPRFAVNFTGAETNSFIRLDFGAVYSGAEDKFFPGALASSQYAASSTTIQQNQDGYGAGFLQQVSVDTQGIVSASYSNGSLEPVAQLALANFANEGGLTSQGAGVFSATSASGPATTDAPTLSGLGSISPGSLELSNVDLARELTDLMVTRHSFRANIQVIQSQDEMLGSLLDIKT